MRWRLVIGYSLFLASIIGGVGVFVLTTLEATLMQEADETLALRASQVVRILADTSRDQLDIDAASAALFDLEPLEEFSAPGIYVEVLDNDGTLLTASPNLPGGHLPGEPLAIAAALSGRDSFITIPVGLERVRVLARPVRVGDRQIGIVLVGESLHSHDIAISGVKRLLGLSAVAAVLVSLLGNWWLAGRVLATIAEVTRVARRIALTGKFEQRIEARSVRDELGDLIATFNEMLTSLESVFRHHRDFLADASHELRGPLMVIRGNLDLLKRDLPAREREESAREAAEEADRMARLLSDLLFLAKSDSQPAMEWSPVDLSVLVLQSLDRASSLDTGDHQLVLARNEPAVVRGDPERLSQMLWNLVHNALRYTPPGGQITVSLRIRAGMARMLVADAGVGIPAEHQPRIFERFYRVDRSRSREDGGAGLGLSIVKQVAEAHGGQVRVCSRSGKGSVFLVTLPLITA
jgi:two-component system, OmpR family, sensor kinase